MRRSTRRSSVVDVGHSLVGNFSTRFSLPSFLKRVNKLTNSQRNAITLLGFGNVLQIPDLKLAKNFLVELMDRWCCESRAFRLVPGNITITLMDVALILGLRVTGEPVILDEDCPFSELEMEYGATLGTRKITIPSIEERLDSLGCIDDENFVRTFLLFIFGTLLFPNTTGKVDSRYLSLLSDLDKVRRYAWGGAVLEDIFNWLCKRKEMHVQYIGGCLILLQIWCYEHIDIARPNLLYCSLSVPRICRWGNIKNIRTLSREWFTTKFNELQNSQVIWELKPTCIETEVDIVKELLELQSGTGEPYLVQSSSTSDSIDHEDDVPSRSHEHIGVDLVSTVDVQDTIDMHLVREMAEVEEDDSMELTPQQNASISSINNTTHAPTEQQFEKTNTSKIVFMSDEDDEPSRSHEHIGVDLVTIVDIQYTPDMHLVREMAEVEEDDLMELTLQQNASITSINNTNHVPTEQQFEKTNTSKIVFISDEDDEPSRSHEHIGVDLVTIVDIQYTPDMHLVREMSEVEEDDSMELTPQQNASITSINNTNHVPTEQQFEKTNTSKIVFIGDDVEDGLMSRKTEFLDEEIARLKKENDELRKENELLKDKIFSSPSLEEENVDLKEEVDSYNRLVARLKELVFDESLDATEKLNEDLPVTK